MYVSSMANGQKILNNKKEEQKTKEEQRKKQLNEIWVMCEAQRQMHSLAHVYFSFRERKFHILPLTTLTMLSGILAFLATAAGIPEGVKTYLSISVGILTILSSGVQSMNQESRYDSKAEMHKNASLGMKKILDQIEFLQVTPQVNGPSLIPISAGAPSSSKLKPALSLVEENEQGGENGANGQKGGDAIETKQSSGENNEYNSGPALITSNEEEGNGSRAHTFMEVYQQVLDSCQSQIPVRISQAFKMAESRLSISLTKEDKSNLKVAYGFLGKQIIHRSLYNEVFCTIEEYYMFPYSCPRPDETVNLSMLKVQKYFMDRTIYFRRDEHGGLASEEADVIV